MAVQSLPPIAGSTPQNILQGHHISSQGVNLSGYSTTQLIDLRAQIDTLLPIKSLKNVNMERELVIQLQIAQKLQTDSLNDDEIPANQKSQVLNSVANALGTLARLQVELYDSERLKVIESVLIEAVNSLPEDVQHTFFAEYERLLGVTHG